MRAEADAKAKENLENLQQVLDDIHQEMKDFADAPIEELMGREKSDEEKA